MSSPVMFSEGYSRKLYGQGGLKPAFVDHQRGVGHAPAPLFHYRGADVPRCCTACATRRATPRGHQVEFVNPVTGEVVKTLDYSAQLLRPGEETELKRETAGTYYVVIEAAGQPRSAASASNGDTTTCSWCRTPVAAPHQYRQDGCGDLSPPPCRNIGQYYAQGRAKDGKVTQLVQ